MIVAQLAVQSQEPDQTEVAEVLVQRVGPKEPGHGGGVFPCIVGLQLHGKSRTVCVGYVTLR